MKGKELLTILEKVENGVRYDIWNLLPEAASGPVWGKEIEYTAGRIREYVEAENDYSLEDLRDLSAEYANSECENYYTEINKEVQELSLWAMPEIEEEVAALGMPEASLTKLMSSYLYTAKRMVWDAIADQAFQQEDEEVSA